MITPTFHCAALAGLLLFTPAAFAQPIPDAPSGTPAAEAPAAPSETVQVESEGVSIRFGPDGVHIEPATAEDTGVLAPEEEVKRLRREMRVLQREMESLRTTMSAPTPPTPPVPPVAPTPPTPPEAPRAPAPPGLKDKTSFGSPIKIGAGQEFRDVTSFGGPIDVEGHIYGDVASFGGPIQLHPGAVVEGDAISFGGPIQVHPGAVLKGDRLDMSGGPTAFGPSFSLSTNDEAAEDHDQAHASDRHETSFIGAFFRKLVFLLSLAGAGVLVVGLFPNRVARVATDIQDHPIRSATVGFFASLVLSVVSVIFAITILGLPLSLLLWAFLGLAWLMGFVGLCQALGDRLPFEQKPHGRWIAFLGGVLLVSFVGSLPFVGWLVVLAVSLLGIGGSITSKFGAP